MNAVSWVAFVLVVIGGLNWGLVGLFDFDVVATIFGADSMVTDIVYVLVALGAIYMVATSSKMVKTSAPASTTM